ncbi:MAG: hypothetical protein H6Q78_1764 [Candidatus Krumholzibacteriota bacterium]|nr:hypothetical protein [Candidatus Krumholzibacteriota bacterium]
MRSERLSVMIIQCESCASRYFLPDSRIPRKPVRVSCPKCHAVFRLAAPKENHFAAPPASVIPSGLGSARAAAPVVEPPAAAPAPRVSGPRSSASRGPDDRARRLARVLVSDILCYHREKRDQALLDGNLMTALGDEIKKSWELYKQKVGPELAGSTDYFKQALNEILADGQKLF